jgi:hypothetical protein
VLPPETRQLVEQLAAEPDQLRELISYAKGRLADRESALRSASASPFALELRARYEAGATTAELADAEGRSAHFIARQLKEAGTIMRQTGRRRKERKPDSP